MAGSRHGSKMSPLCRALPSKCRQLLPRSVLAKLLCIKNTATDAFGNPVLLRDRGMCKDCSVCPRRMPQARARPSASLAGLHPGPCCATSPSQSDGCRSSDDCDTTEEIKISFHGPLNSTEVHELVPRLLDSAMEAKKEIQVDAPEETLLRWPCRANCGSFAERKLKYNGAFPTAVFCSQCSQKRRDSWRARVCRAANCQNYVKYHVFELQVMHLPEPKLCIACSKLEGVTYKMQKGGEDMWRMKKCQKCRQQMEFYLPDEPVDCSDCAQKAPVSGTEESEGVASVIDSSEAEDSDDDWSLVSESLPSVAKYLSKEECEECSAQVTEKGQRFTCQSAKHSFCLCGSKGCLKKFEKKCEDAAGKRGKSGQKKIDFAKHRGSSPCPLCGLLLTEGPVNCEQECVISGTGPTCFPWGTLLIVPGPDGALKPIQTFRPNDTLISAQGHCVKVKVIEHSEEGDQELISLQTAKASLLVTKGHRVMVERGDRAQPLQAAAIQLGDHVLISGGGKEKLVKKELLTIRTVLVDLEVAPNEPLAAFPPLPEAIQSMGREQSRTRRGRKPAGNETESWEKVSIPNTDDGF
ncbi:vwkA [Symbiodinium sp. CCMP2592]|nr:vwkA [Symbiodinium sp. CCMP2592]